MSGCDLIAIAEWFTAELRLISHLGCRFLQTFKIYLAAKLSRLLCWEVSSLKGHQSSSPSFTVIMAAFLRKSATRNLFSLKTFSFGRIVS